ncbi:MAG: tRNA-binding protein [Flavobacteriales bacterium]|jgi:tRNA-binding protein
MELHITPGEFFRADLRVGTIVEALPFPEARKPAIRLRIHFGPEIGELLSSAQIAALYNPEELAGRQVIAVVNFPPKQIGPILSQCLVLGAPDAQGDIVLLGTERPVADGVRIA